MHLSHLLRTTSYRVLGIVAIIYVPVALLSTVGMSIMISTAGSADSAFPVISIVVYIIGILIALVGQQLCQAALFRCIGGAYLGESISVGKSYRFMLPMIWRDLSARRRPSCCTTI